MNAQKNGTTAKRVTRREQRGPAVHWRCVVPGCSSNSNIKRHSFPKNVTRSDQWLQAINNPNLGGLTSDELRNYRICQLHFPESAYKITSVRQVLHDDAVPQLMLNVRSSASSASTRDSRVVRNIEAAEDEKMQENCTLKNPLNELMDFKVLPSWDDIYTQETCSPPAVALPNSSKGVLILKKNRIESTTQHSDAHISSKSSSSVQNVEPSSSKDDSASKEAMSAPKTSKTRTVLGSVTRKNKLIPVAKCLHGIASDLLKKRSKYAHKLGTLKERLQRTEKYTATVDTKKLKNLSRAELRFFKMLTRNINRNINRLLKGKDSGARAQTHLAKQARIQYTKKCRKK